MKIIKMNSTNDRRDPLGGGSDESGKEASASASTPFTAGRTRHPSKFNGSPACTRSDHQAKDAASVLAKTAMPTVGTTSSREAVFGSCCPVRHGDPDKMDIAAVGTSS